MSGKELPGFYYDPEKRQYFRISGSGSSGGENMTPQSIMRRNAYRASKQQQERIRQNNVVPIPQAIDLLQSAGVHTSKRRRQFERSIMENAMINMKPKFRSRIESLPVREASQCFSSTGIITAAYAAVDGGSAVISSRVSYQDGEAAHPVSNIHPSHKIADLKPKIIQDHSFAVTACQGLRQCRPFITVRPAIQDLILDDLANTYEFSDQDTIWSVAPTSDSIAAGLEGRIEFINCENGERRRLPMKENVFVLESEDNKLYAGTNKGNILTIDERSEKIEQTFKVGSSLSNVKISDQFVAASAFNNTLMLFDRRNTEHPLHQFTDHKNSSTPHLGLILDSSLGILMSSSNDCVIRCWSVQDFKLVTSVSDEEFIKIGAPPCILLEKSWSPLSVLTVLYADKQIYYEMSL